MARFSLSFRSVNKILLLVTIASLAYRRGHFSGTLIPSPFQMLFVLSLLLTFVYVVQEHTFRTFFQSFPKKITIAFACLYVSVLVGWVIGNFVVGIPTMTSTLQDFGTFTISTIIFFMVLFYAKDDERYARWCLYMLLIPALYPFYYFFAHHGFVGYWGVPNDGSLSGLVDPNILSKTLLIPALFFISQALFSIKKTWQTTVGYGIAAILYVALIFWTASRGSALSLIAGAGLLWILFSWYQSNQQWSWKKTVGAALAILVILSAGFLLIPQGVKHEIYTKIKHTGALPRSADGTLLHIADDPSITVDELRQTPRADVRIFEWSYFLKYGFHHPLGVGPSASSVDYQNKDGNYLQLRPGNTYIQVWLWGGIVALLSFLYIVWNALRAGWQRWSKNADAFSLAVLSAVFALSIAIIFDASLYFHWYFILLGIVCSLAYERA